jgi:predicted RNase H-like HicB family nuclease
VELSVLVQRVEGNGYRAWSSEPLSASAEGATRDEALAKLRTAIVEQLKDGVEVVRLQIHTKRSGPVWPDDEITRAWLEGIVEARRQADQKPDPWDEINSAAQP